MGVLDFLFEGKPPPSVTTYGNSTENIPKWLSDYTQGIISRANSVAGEGYQTYGGPRIADFNQDQNEGFDLTRANIGSYKPGMDLARSFEEQAGETSALGAASPYLGRASQSFPEARAAYMDPYVDDVVNRAELDASRFYDEKIKPSLNNQFTAAGQYGSSQHEREALKAGRDLTEGLQSTSLAARSDGYKTAGTLFGADATRQGQLAQTAGQLSTADAGIKANVGNNLASMAESGANMGYKDSAALGAIGTQQQGMDQANLDLAYQDFQGQRDYDRQSLDWLNALVKGIPYDTTKTSTEKGPLSGATYQPSTASSILAGISAIKGMGTGEDGGFDWGNILGSGGGSGGGWADIFGGGNNGGSGMTWGGTAGWARGGRVNTKALDAMLAQLRAKRGSSEYDDYEDVPVDAYVDGE